MKFIEKTYGEGEKFWELQIEATIPCTEEEQKIYGVKFKRDVEESSMRKPHIHEIKFNDSDEVFYLYVSIRGCYQSKFFKNLEEAKKSLIKEYSEE